MTDDQESPLYREDVRWDDSAAALRQLAPLPSTPPGLRPLMLQAAGDIERLREEDRQWDKHSLVEIVRERDRLRAWMVRAMGCLRNCSGKIYHPRMPNLVAALEKEITELTK